MLLQIVPLHVIIQKSTKANIRESMEVIIQESLKMIIQNSVETCIVQQETDLATSHAEG